jgi:hypothetical protein
MRPTPFHRLLFVAILLAQASVVKGGDEPSPITAKIDADLRAVWTAEKIAPSDRSTDSEFLRRIYLDLVGVVPTYEETKAFLDDNQPDKRTKLIDALLGDPRFARQQADVWDLVLFGRNPPNSEATRKRDGFKKWLAGQFAGGEPLDQVARRLLLADDEGSELFYVQFRNQAEEATVAVSRIFLGMQLQCARCHDHPYETWTQRDFYGMAGFFVRLVVVESGSGQARKYKVGEKSVGEVLFTGAVKDQKPGQKGAPIRPKFLGGDLLDEPPPPKDVKKEAVKANTLPPRPEFSRKEKIAAWVTQPGNPYFARAMANRLWAQFMGRGIVHPVDDLGGKNSPSHPELLEALTRRLIETKFDLKSFVRVLVMSDAYQLASTGPTRDALPQWYERARVRPLSAEELMASFKAATRFPADGFKGSGEPTEYMLRFFGEPTDGLGHFQGSLSEHLFLNNASHLRLLAQPRKGNLGDAILTMEGSWDDKVDCLFLSMLNRPPSAAERKRFVDHLNGDPKMQSALIEEAIWALMCCSEFRFNH